MKITIEITNYTELEKLLLLFKSLNLNSIQVVTTPATPIPTITKGDKSIDPTELFGIWKDAPRTLESIRKEGWVRNQNQ